MNLKDFWYTTQHILRDKKVELSFEQWNRYLQLANNDLKKTVYGFDGDPHGYETSQKIRDELSPFLATSDITLTLGVGVRPTDYWHKSAMIDTSSGVTVRILNDREFNRKRTQTITGPSASNPICKITNTQIIVLPVTTSQVTFTYLKTDTPTIDLKSENGIQVYDSTGSTELLWGDDKFIDLVRIFIGYLSIPMTNEQLLQYTEAKLAKEA